MTAVRQVSGSPSNPRYVPRPDLDNDAASDDAGRFAPPSRSAARSYRRTGKPQHKTTLADPFKIVSGGNSGGGVAYRHPAMIEMVPFFVHPDFASDEGRTALCRIPHYLRFSPAWAMGNLDSPYPLHLGDALIDDQLCILGLGDD